MEPQLILELLVNAVGFCCLHCVTTMSGLLLCGCSTHELCYITKTASPYLCTFLLPSVGLLLILSGFNVFNVSNFTDDSLYF